MPPPDQPGSSGTPPPADGGVHIGPGDRGEAVRDLKRRLVAFGLDPSSGDDPLDLFGPATETALRTFQKMRGLLTSGACDPATWSALVEAGYQLGDRLIYLRRPMLRGDDVSELQRRLDALGFDPRWIDGIFGPDTERALRDFQRNTGITVDGVCGPDVRATLQRLGARSGHDTSVAAVREREQLRELSRRLSDRRVAVGESGGLGALANALSRRLVDAGASVVTLHDPDPSIQAQAANGFGADAFVALGIAEEAEIAFYATDGFESQGGKQLAGCAATELLAVLGPDVPAPRGLRLPILRETRMPAVFCLLGPPRTVVARTAAVAAALDRALESWVSEPVV